MPHPIRPSLWRNAPLLVIGVLHALLRDGDALVIYALSAVILAALRKGPAKALVSTGRRVGRAVRGSGTPPPGETLNIERFADAFGVHTVSFVQRG